MVGDASILSHAVTVTGLLLAGSLMCKLLGEDADAHHTPAAELFRQALHWREIATQDNDSALRLQHAASASAMLQAARTLLRDADLERATGMDVSRLARTLDAQLAEARQSVRPISQ